MAYQIWNIYGYGVVTNDIPVSKERILELAKTAPETYRKLQDMFYDDYPIESATLEEILEYENQYSETGLPAILGDIIEEKEGIRMTVCTDCIDAKYLIYTPGYPWELTEKEKSFTENDIKEIFIKYFSLITDEAIEVCYYDCQNGG